MSKKEKTLLDYLFSWGATNSNELKTGTGMDFSSPAVDSLRNKGHIYDSDNHILLSDAGYDAAKKRDKSK